MSGEGRHGSGMSGPGEHIRAVVFDFDGVLVESVEVKTRAFGRLFEEHGPEIQRQVVEYHLRHGGISRFEKFRYYYRELLRLPLSERELEELGHRFAELVVEEVVGAPWVPGAREFLDQHSSGTPCFVASGTPEQELLRIVERRGMAGYFRQVRGSPTSKADILCSIARDLGVGCSELLMVGDAMTDYDAAVAAGAAFIGRVPTGEVSPFPSGVVIHPDLQRLRLTSATDRLVPE